MIHWEMFSWSYGKLVESSRAIGIDNPMLLVGNGYTPEFLQEPLVGVSVGSQFMIIFKHEMADLPGYFDSADAYVLVVEMLSIKKQQ